MKKISKIAGLALIAAMFVSCATTNASKTARTEEDAENVFYLYNPTDREIAIYDSNDQVVKKAAPKAATAVKSYSKNSKDLYYFMDSFELFDNTFDWKVNIYNQNNYNFNLRLERPETGKKYICLNSKLQNEPEKDNNYSGFNLYEIVDSTHELAYPYSDNLFICAVPSARCWTTSSEFTKNVIGKEFIFDNDFFDGIDKVGFDHCEGWETIIDNKIYMHYVLTLKLITE